MSAKKPLGAACSSRMRTLSTLLAGARWPSKANRLARRELLRAWLPIEESRSLANSVLLVAWHLIHANPALARVLLGMSTSGIGAFRELGVADLAHIARRHPEWVRPRWADRLDLWTALVGGTSGGGGEDPRSLTLRCLKASARDLKWLSAYVELSP